MCGSFPSVLWHATFFFRRFFRVPDSLRWHESSPMLVDRRDYVPINVGSEFPVMIPLQTETVSENEIQKLQGEVIEFQQQLKWAEDDLNNKTMENASLKNEAKEFLKKFQVQQNLLKNQIAARTEECQRLIQQLKVVELGNSQGYTGGESFLETEATPHLLYMTVERVSMTLGIFTKHLMEALKNGGVNCSSAAKALVPSVSLERDGHTKFVYQALICDVLFYQFENDSFYIQDNAPDTLDSEIRIRDNFERYKQLKDLQNPEELVFADAADSDFRRFCNKKRTDLIAVLSRTVAPGADNVGVLIFGNLFGPDGIRKEDWSRSVAEVKLASSFIKFALSVFFVHKLAFALRPKAEIFRPTRDMKFDRNYMTPILVSSEESDDDEGDNHPVVFGVGLMIVPGFKVNRIVIRSKVYMVRRA